MERKDIIFDGVSNVPDDSLAQDGQLSLSVNAIKHNGSVQPVERGTPEKHDSTYNDGAPINIVRNERLEYIHHLPDTDEERYIVISSEIWVSDIALNPSELELNVGEEDTLVPTFVPDDATNKSVTWSSSDKGVATVDENGKVTAIRKGNATITCKAADGSNVTETCNVRVIRPATPVTSPVESIDLSYPDYPLQEGETYTIGANILPAEAADAPLTWASSNPDVATVDEDGHVTALLRGECVITCTAADGSGVSATCSIEVCEPDYVDLGVGALWATKNVGATNSEDYGIYVSWGEKEQKSSYKWGDYTLGNGTTFSKYNDTDGKLELDEEDDAASTIIGGRWQTPSKQQIEDLLNGTNQSIVTHFGHKCLKVTSKANPLKSIYLPAAGGYSDEGLANVGTHGKYWSRTRVQDDKSCAIRLYFDNTTAKWDYRTDTYRKYGYTIRPIYIGEVPKGRPRKEETSTINTTFTLTDRGSKIEFGGKLDEGRTLTMELTYNDGKKETVSVTFTKSSTYTLPTRYNTSSRVLTNARVISYDDSSVTLNITWRIKNPSPYYTGSIGTWAGFPIQDETEANLLLGSESPMENIEGEESVEEPLADDYSSGYTPYDEIVTHEVYSGTPTSTKSGIAADGSPLHISWFNRQDGTRKEIAEISSPIREITSVKNVLIISTDAGLYFARNIGEGYQWLGQLPELPCVTPFLTSQFVMSNNFPNNDLGNDFIDTDGLNIENNKPYTPSRALKEELWGKLSAYFGNLQKIIHKSKRFLLPFYVRVAYRMFDGTYISVSRPYPMCPSTEYFPMIPLFADPDVQKRYHFQICAAASTLQLKIKGQVTDEWKDIITGFDVFISPEIADYTSDDSGDTIDYLYFSDDFEDNVTSRGEIPFCFSKQEDIDVAKTRYPIDATQSGGTRIVHASTTERAAGDHVDFGSNADLNYFVTFLVVDRNEGSSIRVILGDDDVELFFNPDGSWNGEPYWLVSGDEYYDEFSALFGSQIESFYIFPQIISRPTLSREVKLKNIQILSNVVTVSRYKLYLSGSLGSESTMSGIIKTRRSTGQSVEDAFRKVGEFYKIDSVNFADLNGVGVYEPHLSDADIDMFSDIDLLTSKTLLDNKVINRYGFTCNDLYAYNNRLNVVIDNQELETPDYADNLYMGVDEDQTRQEKNILYACEVVKNGVSRFVAVPATEDCVTYADGLRYFFYPNQNAIRLLEYIVDEDTIRSYSLTKHEGIYGSYAFNDWNLLEPYETLTITDESSDEDKAAFNELARKIQEGYNKEFHVGNKILQSDVDNPFAFLNSGVVQLGCETIHRICATARPISEGQKGKHDLYAFTDEGIYAIAVNNIGEYEKADLVSPEVITSGDVHQVEQNVLFASSKGLMSISGNDLVCLSSKIEGHNHAEGLTAIEEVKDALGLEYVGSLGFHAKDWFTTAELVYDAKNELIYIFQEPMPKNGIHDINLGLVYDVNEGVWGMYENKLLYGVNSYTDALAVQMTDVKGNGVLVNMSEPLNRHNEKYKSLLITRPMQFGEQDSYKTMEDIILRGAQGTNKGMLVIWAGNDLEHWKVIGSSKKYKWRNYSGTPYKYFRVGVLMNEWQEGDSITGASVDITTRLTNKLR